MWYGHDIFFSAALTWDITEGKKSLWWKKKIRREKSVWIFLLCLTPSIPHTHTQHTHTHLHIHTHTHTHTLAARQPHPHPYVLANSKVPSPPALLSAASLERVSWLDQCLSLVFQIGPARFRAPELLFRPDLIGEECEGIHEVLSYAIQKSDVDLRKTLYSNIVLSGGSTLFKGL